MLIPLCHVFFRVLLGLVEEEGNHITPEVQSRITECHARVGRAWDFESVLGRHIRRSEGAASSDASTMSSPELRRREVDGAGPDVPESMS